MATRFFLESCIWGAIQGKLRVTGGRKAAGPVLLNLKSLRQKARENNMDSWEILSPKSAGWPGCQAIDDPAATLMRLGIFQAYWRRKMP